MRLVLIKESLGGSSESYLRLIESTKANLLSGTAKMKEEMQFVKLHVNLYLRDHPGKLISIGLRADLIRWVRIYCSHFDLTNLFCLRASCLLLAWLLAC